MFTKRQRIGRTIDDLQPGNKWEETIPVTDKEILLYLGMSGDANPAYIQHDYAAGTPYKRPQVPQLMLQGMVTSAVSNHLPGPGTVLKEMHIRYDAPLYHEDTLHLKLVLTDIRPQTEEVTIQAEGMSGSTRIFSAAVIAVPPYPWKPATEQAFSYDNF
ncbi:MaoC/PaaZ C-terminal domain-containing protein [Alkalicoccus urumqiensis]|uniref:Enoyl-CoA hydratase n=1 Tax=Alkalicoccus urumqiensis TaxID=1548213 RepID=A0A2P6MDG0_ALKUR|nr:MaoC/PaaZ C-terminal domain-containing protein [Alkalicoccus urumqiensis]PRO64315.1 enoyl-CoA hydratase [Alkalicoccus urumqiensis]